MQSNSPSQVLLKEAICETIQDAFSQAGRKECHACEKLHAPCTREQSKKMQ